MSGEEYPIATLVQIARIPEEAFDRFMEEFPLIVATTRAHVQLVEQLYESAGLDKPDDAALTKGAEGALWIDDDEQTVEISLSAEREDGSVETLFAAHGNRKTGKLDLQFPVDAGDAA